jgi:hypothetical protein
MHHTMKAYRKMEVELHTFLTLTLVGDCKVSFMPKGNFPSNPVGKRLE